MCSQLLRSISTISHTRTHTQRQRNTHTKTEIHIHSRSHIASVYSFFSLSVAKKHTQILRFINKKNEIQWWHTVSFFPLFFSHAESQYFLLNKQYSLTAFKLKKYMDKGIQNSEYIFSTVSALIHTSAKYLYHSWQNATLLMTGGPDCFDCLY